MSKGGVVIAVVLTSVASACGGGPRGDTGPLPSSDPEDLVFAPEVSVDLSAMEKTASGLYLQDIVVGDGPAARRTSRVWVKYVGRLPDGSVFDANLGGEPYHTRLGGSEVIRGWNEGIVGMRRGGIRRLVVPPHLAYGARGTGDVPPGATLIFDLELVDLQ